MSSKRVYAVMGATGHIGGVISKELLKTGHDVRVLGRSVEKLKLLMDQGAHAYRTAFDQPKTLAEAFRGAYGVFTMIPPDNSADNYLGYMSRVGEAIVQALRDSGVKYVVNLSGFGAHLIEGTGPIQGQHKQEVRLNQLTGVHIVHLRPHYFMENLLRAIPRIQGAGIHPSLLRADLPLPMVATRDIGVKAADLMERLGFSGQSVIEFFGPRAVTMHEATTALGKAIGRPDLKYVQLSYADAEKVLLGSGMKASLVGLIIEMNRALNEGKLAPTQQPGVNNQGKTTINDFARVVFAPAFHG